MWLSCGRRLNEYRVERGRRDGERSGGGEVAVFVRTQQPGAPVGSPGPDPRVVEELCAELAELYPDPADVFEDALAERLGLRRHPECDLETWRRVRVRAIDSLEGAAGVAS